MWVWLPPLRGISLTFGRTSTRETIAATSPMIDKKPRKPLITASTVTTVQNVLVRFPDMRKARSGRIRQSTSAQIFTAKIASATTRNAPYNGNIRMRIDPSCATRYAATTGSRACRGAAPSAAVLAFVVAGPGGPLRRGRVVVEQHVEHPRRVEVVQTVDRELALRAHEIG